MRYLPTLWDRGKQRRSSLAERLERENGGAFKARLGANECNFGCSPDAIAAMDRAAAFPSRQDDFIRDYSHLRAYGPHAFGWTMEDLSAIGAVGNAAGASAEIGEAILDHAVGGLLDLLKDVEKHPGFAG